MGNERRRGSEPFCLDRVNECLWSGSREIKLRPKAFALLSHLMLRSGQLVSKEELLNTVWPETFVGDAVLKVTIGQLREALNDDSTAPKFIETAHRRGYRFTGKIAECGAEQTRAQEIGRSQGLSKAPLAVELAQEFVGREHVVSRMRGYLAKMLSGERQIIFVTGEAGIGKTTLVDAFARTIASNQNIRIARGQCLEHYGTSEAYLPFLAAIGRLCREQQQIIEVLRAHAPMWLMQMPSLVSASERETLSRELAGATRERMLRESGGALEALTADQPLVLILEDLHWSDYSTLDLISYLARQRQIAHLMLIGTYRMVELIVSGHPLKAVKQELRAKQQCEEIPLEYLRTEAVAEYLSVRFPSNEFPPKLAELIHERTEGNPLFMVNAVDYLQAAGLIVEEHEECWKLAADIETVEVGVPDSIRQMIEKQLEHLHPNDQRMLEAASVAGTEISVLAVVAAMSEDRAMVEARCDELASRRHFIQDCGIHVLPNGEAVTRYGFIHALYQNVLYERVSTSQRVHLHRRIAEGGEEVYGKRAREIAAELAMHFERGHDYERAAKYLQQAADNAIRRFAYREAVGLARRGLELLERLPDSRERAEQELSLRLTLGVPLIAIESYAAAEVGSTYTRARELCQQLGETREIFQVLWGLWVFHLLRADLGIAREIAEEFLRLAERLPNPGLAARGHVAVEATLMHLAEFAPAMAHFEKALLLYDPEQDRDDSFRFTQNPGVGMRCHGAWTLWFLGQPDQALERMQEALTIARELSEPHGVAHTLYFLALLHRLRREPRLSQENAEASMDVSSEHGLVLYQASATLVRGWALMEQGLQEEGIEQMRQGLAAHRATGTEMARPFFLALLGEALGKANQPEEGLKLLEEAVALVQLKGERCYLPELYRIKGGLVLMQSISRGGLRATRGEKAAVESALPLVALAEGCFSQSIKIAQQQKAKSWELRAAISLARLYQKQNKQEEGRDLLAEIYNRFTEGFDTMDLREAKLLLDELSRS